jgi:hypothetical protein
MKNKAKYVLDLFKFIYNLNNQYDINYGINNRSNIQIKIGNVEYFQKEQELSLENIIWKNWNDEQIPFFFDTQDNDIITFTNNNAIINFDIVASSFYLLSCWQEYIDKNRDKFGRFRFKDSIQYKLNIAFQPVVNYYFDILKHAIEKIYNTQLQSKLWQKNDFAVFVSHDIDTCESAWKQASYWQMRNGNFIMPFHLIYNKLKGKDGWFNFDQILDIEKKLEISSTFFFISNSTPRKGFRNGDYDLTKRKFSKVFKDIQKHNSEIGLHSGFGAHLNSDYLNHDINKMPLSINGNRFHYLNFDIGNTPNLLQNTNLKYDSTMGFAESAGFRSSFCLPYFLYDIKKDCQTSIVEIPLVIMDSSLRLKCYMNLSQEEIAFLTKRLVKEIKKFNGIFSINWHNTRFSDLKDPGWADTFIKIVNICKNENANFFTGEEIINRFKN